MAEEQKAHDPKAVEEVKKAASTSKKQAKARSRTQPRAEEERNTIEHKQAVPSVTLNPADQEAVAEDLVVGVETEDEGDLEFNPAAFEGVSHDRLFKAANSHGYPVVTDEEIEAAEEERKAVEEANAEREKEREERREAEEKVARQRLTDFLKG